MNRGLVLHEFGKMPVLEQLPKPVPKEGQLLVKVAGAALNPSDRYRVLGVYMPPVLPCVVGLEGTGIVEQAQGEAVQHWVGKRVSFIAQPGFGSWAEYSISDPTKTFQIDSQVPLHCASSGIVNPLTVIGMVDIFQSNPKAKGIIHTAAASALGRMLNKYCLSLKIPLLNIVRKKQQYDLLKSEGAEHVIITDQQGNWKQQYAAAVAAKGFNMLFDALGGGSITQVLIMNLPSYSQARIYGLLDGKPLTLANAINLCKGITITGYLVFVWFMGLPKEKQLQIKATYSALLKGDLSTTLLESLPLTKFEKAWQLSTSHATQGKITLLP